MSNSRVVSEELLNEAEKALRKKFSDDLKIASAEYLSEPTRRNVIVRLHLDSSLGSTPASVILKQSLPITIDAENADAKKSQEENTRAFSRFARDWAGLEFTGSIPQTTHNAPHFYGSNQKLRFILIEDLGQPHVSLVDSLTRSDSAKAVEALERYVKALASFHAASSQHTQKYLEILRNIDPAAHMPNRELELTAKDLKVRLNLTLQHEKLDLISINEFLNEVDQILDGVFIPGPFTVLTHGDIAPDNVFDQQNELQLIDFEWCGLRNALLDGTYLRMSIPTGWCAKKIPEETLAHIEKMYRDELSKGIPSVRNDKEYYEAYVQACGYHALQQMAAAINCLEENNTWSPPGFQPPLPPGSLWDESTNFLRPRCISRLQTFIEQAEKRSMFPHTRKMATDMLGKFKKLWPDAKPLDLYPAFKSVALESRTINSTPFDSLKRGPTLGGSKSE